MVKYYCLQNSEQIGGTDKVVEIEEAKFGKRKFNCGHAVEGQWVFGGLERNSKRIFMVPVPDRTRDTFLGEIKKYILPGTKIENEGYLHETVNHSVNSVDPESGASTNNTERSWRDARSSVPRYGCWDECFDQYLALQLFSRKFPDHKQRSHQLLLCARQLYPGSTD